MYKHASRGLAVRLCISVACVALLAGCDDGNTSTAEDTNTVSDTSTTGDASDSSTGDDTGTATDSSADDTNVSEDTSTSGDTGVAEDTRLALDVPEGGPFYHDHVASILAENCVTCHQAGGIAPFSLETYADAAPLAGTISSVTTSRQMPPFSVDNSGDCHTFQSAQWLEDSEIAMLQAWDEAGAPEGDPANNDAVVPPGDELTNPTTTFDIGAPYTPDGSLSDDYRCFIVDPGNASDAFMTAFQVRPDNEPIVHHMVLYSVPSQTAEDQARQMDANSPDTPGYRCFGTSNLSGSSFLAAWAPGQNTVRYPEGTGVRLAGGRPVIMQIHYNLENGAAPDRTQVDVQIAETVDNEAVLAPLLGLDLYLQPQSAEEVYSKTFAGGGGFGFPSVPSGAVLRGVFPHMHTLGTSLDLELVEDSGDTCLLDLPRWDFNWQRTYFYEAPIQLPSSPTFRLTCRYDTRSRSQPVSWGEGTMDEMCLAFLYVTAQ